MKAFEYMAAGVPIVASDIPALAEILTNGLTAVLVAPTGPEALAGGILQILNDPTLGSALAARALAGVKGNSWEARAARIIEFVRSRT
jgi:glycosyltransferase involved in cell wall biosynthesis